MYYLMEYKLLSKTPQVQDNMQANKAFYQNSYNLTLDGDVDFTVQSFRKLLDVMKRDARVGAVCGRIHPIGKGIPYQSCVIGHELLHNKPGPSISKA